MCYPSTQTEIRFIKYLNPVNQTSNKIGILGIPLIKDSVHEVKQVLIKRLASIEKELCVHNNAL